MGNVIVFRMANEPKPGVSSDRIFNLLYRERGVWSLSTARGGMTHDELKSLLDNATYMQRALQELNPGDEVIAIMFRDDIGPNDMASKSALVLSGKIQFDDSTDLILSYDLGKSNKLLNKVLTPTLNLSKQSDAIFLVRY